MESVRPIDSTPYHAQIFILGGQSNMEGRGPMIGEEAGKFPDREFIYTIGGKWIRPAFEPTHSTEPEFGGSQFPDLWPHRKKRGRGPSLAFANKWAELNPGNGQIALVPAAKGNTNLRQHLPGTRLYDAIHRRIRNAEAVGSVFAFLDSQGESDAENIADAGAWADRYGKIIAARRNDHGSGIPVIFTQLGDNPNLSRFPHWETVKQQQELAASIIPAAFMIATDGLPKQDGIHFTNEAYQQIGEMMASALFAMQAKK